MKRVRLIIRVDGSVYCLEQVDQILPVIDADRIEQRRRRECGILAIRPWAWKASKMAGVVEALTDVRVVPRQNFPMADRGSAG